MALVLYDKQGSTQGVDNSRALVPLAAEKWPRVPTAERRRVCQFTTAVHTAVNKAQSHLELLQNAIEDWFDDYRSSATSRASKHVDQFPDQQFKKSSSSFFSDELNNDLEVIGVGQQLPAGYCHVMEQGVPIPYLGADEVLTEVMHLLARMEADRKETEKGIADERVKVKELSERIDELSEMKLLKIPDAVQLEHEACENDIIELQWHIAHRTKELNKTKKREIKMRNFNRKLKEEILFINKHRPLVEEKLELELKKMERIKTAKKETKQQLGNTKERCEGVEDKNVNAHKKALAERQQLQNELDHCNRQLEKAKAALQNSYAHHEKLVKGIAEKEIKVQQIGVKIETLKTADKKVATEEENQQSTVDKLKKDIRDQENFARCLDEENTGLQREFDVLKSTQTELRNELQKSVDKQESRFTFVRRENEELEMESEIMEKKLKECEDQKEADKKNKSRIKRELENTAAQMDATMVDFTKLADEHSKIREKLEFEERKIRQLEDQLRDTLVQLQRQIEDEIKSRETIETRMLTDSSDLEKSKMEAEVKRERMTKMVTEIEKAVKMMTQKVAKLQAEADVRAATVAELQAALDELAAQHAEMFALLGGEVDRLQPTYDHLTSTLAGIEKQLEEMRWQTDMMNKKLEDLRDSSLMIGRIKEKLEVAISMLEEQFKELSFILQAQEREDDSLVSSTNALIARLEQTDKKHKILMENRGITSMDLEKQLEQAKASNIVLAGKYRAIRTDFMEMKERLLDVTNEQNQLEEAVGDVKHLQRLQQRLYGALKLFLNYKNVYNNQERDRMEKEASYNSYKVEALQTEMNNSIDGIGDFLKTEIDHLMNGARKETTESS